MFRINESTAEIFLYDDIGPAWLGMIDDGMIVEALSLFDGRRVTARINSPGGDVFVGHSIANAFRRHQAGVDTAIDGIAASIAASIAIAGETVTIAKNASFMIHNPWTVTMGDANELRRAADALDSVRASIVSEMVDRSGLDQPEVEELMNAETYFTSAEAVSMGFVDSIGLAVISDSAVESSRESLAARLRAQPKRETEEVMAVTPYRTAASIRNKRQRV